MTISTSDELIIATFSDIHLGNKRNSTSKIIENLNREIINNPQAFKWNILFLAGDVFDTLLELKSDEVEEIKYWIAGLLKFCQRHDIILRILEGTPSHDWNQSRIFITLANILKLENLDISYIDKIDIEYIPRYDINILYVPDEIKPSTEEIYSDVKELLRLKGLTKVDYAIMHGQFDFQLPSHITGMPRHNSSLYLEIVKHYIFIGHIHTHSLFDRIVAQGSFDRLTHGQEEPKGYAVSIVNETERNVFFVENKSARTYITVNCRDLSLENSLQLIKAKCEKLPDNSCIRIEGEMKHPVFANMAELIKLYPMFVWSKLAKDKDDNKKEVIVEEEITYIPITITSENIISLLRPRLDHGLKDKHLIDRSIEIMREFI